ncbi:hypothetical protein FN846DRAFT_765578, partial [Sphaerosporella brunnea]
WAGWPPAAFEEAVLRWFFDHIDPLVCPRPTAAAHEVAYVPSGQLVLKNGDAMRKGDLLLCSRAPGTESERLHWPQVRVVGELKSNADKDGRDKAFVQLANYVREIFGTQPQRSWVLAYTLCGAVMRVFRFDRSGAVASTPIDIHESPHVFLGALKGFAMMDSEQIGFDPTIRWCPYATEQVYDPTIHFILPSLPDPFIVAGGTKYRICRSFLVRRYAISTRGTVCWRARPFDAPEDSAWVYVIKDQWRAAKRDIEGDFLSRISPGTTGLPKYIWHYNIHSSSGTVVDVAGYVRGHSTSVHPSPQTLPAPPPLTNTSRHLYQTGHLLQNRIKTRLIMSPLGQPLLSFTSYKHLLLALRDAILGHRHMYLTHGVVHRDVSLNNVLLHPTAPHGFLIDFDFAISRFRPTLSGARFITGTFLYMAIDVLGGLERDAHNPIHDLESFYYVLLDICINYDASGTARSP